MKKSLLFLAAFCLTIAASAKTVNADTGDAFAWHVQSNTALSAGDTVLITADEIKYSYNITVQNFPLTIMAADGVNPVFTFEARFNLTNTLTVKNVNFVGIGTNEFFRITAGTGFDLTLDGCSFKNFHYGIRVYSTDAQINKLTINNCIFDTYDSYVIYTEQGNVAPGEIANAVIKNTTIMNGGSSPAIYIRDNDASESTEGPSVLIDHCTLYKNSLNNYTLYLYKIGAQATISNCIVSNPEDAQPQYAYYGYDGNFVNNCMWFNCGKGARSGSVTTNVSNADPLFVNAAAGDFTLRKTSPALNAATDESNLGDPRWGVQGDDASFVINTPASNVNATDSYTISWTANDPTEAATITLQYSTDQTNWTNIVTGLASSTTEYTWNFRGTMAGGTYYIQGTMGSITNVAAGTLTIVPDTEAPRAVDSLKAEIEGTTLTLSWKDPTSPVPFTETFTSLPGTHVSGPSTASVTEEDGAWKIDFTSTTWERAGIKIPCNLNNMTGALNFEYKGNSGYQVLAMVEENGYDWWYKSFTLNADEFTTKSFSTWTNLDWHNTNPSAAFDGNNVTAIYFIINDGAATSEGTFYIKNVSFGGAIPASADYTNTVVRVDNTDYPDTPTDGTAVYDGNASTCTWTVEEGKDYYFSVFTQDDLGNTSEVAHLNWPTSKWGTSVDNVNAEQNAVKVIRNGQVLIIRNNKVYTTLGTEM